MAVRPTAFVTGAIYAALIVSMETPVRKFEFDEVWSDTISEEVTEVLEIIGASCESRSVISSQSKGVQTADCSAGAAREHTLESKWPSIEREWQDESDYALATVEGWLSKFRA